MTCECVCTHVCMCTCWSLCVSNLSACVWLVCKYCDMYDLCVYVCVFMCVYICVYVSVCVCVCVCVFMHVYVSVPMYGFIHAFRGSPGYALDLCECPMCMLGTELHSFGRGRTLSAKLSVFSYKKSGLTWVQGGLDCIPLLPECWGYSDMLPHLMLINI